MPRARRQERVNVGTVTYPPTRCAGCGRCLSRTDRATEGSFYVVTPERLVQIRASMCARCLADAVASHAGLRRLVLAIFLHVAVAGPVRHCRTPAGVFSHARGLASFDED
ncbi:MAG: hypothetical protein M3069_00565 [Chloroflexota bacterium]|nr:hypothetical protein [Chloroflexota bacterium]